jgi:peptidoglycan/LPS O-acetylase OafA/YrhL
MASEFLNYIHRLRGIAILFVVGVHARGGFSDWVTHDTTHKFFVTIFDAHEGNGTVMFLFIGGFLFQHLTSKKFDYGKYLLQKFKVIILPYILISIPIIMYRISTNYDMGGLPEGFHEYPVVYQFLYYIVVGNHMAPFWFISAIIFYYLSAPLFHYLDKPFFYKYILPFLVLASLFTYRPEENANPFLAYLHFLPCYLLGMCVSHYKSTIMKAGWGVIAMLFVVFLAISIVDFNGDPHAHKITFEEVLKGPLFIFNLYYLRAFVVCFLCLFLLYRVIHVKMPFLELLGDYSFGIFFVHFILIAVARKALDVMHVNVDFSLFTFLAFFAFTVLVSTFTVYMIKKATGSYSRMLIGS